MIDKSKLIDGKSLSNEILNDLKIKFNKLDEKTIKPKLVVIIVGEDFASTIYVKRKIMTCKKIGFLSETVKLPKNSTYQKILDTINKYNNDDKTHGILLQIPLPEHSFQKQELLLQSVINTKDVDCFNFSNFGKVAKNYSPLIYPCTPYGIIKLLTKYDIKIKSQKITIIGFSNIVGKPLGLILESKGATITICNIFTKNLKEHTINADIIITATGKKDVITNDMVKEKVVIVDAGILRDKDNKIRGDVDYKNFMNKCSYITPVPNGVGPMTIAILMENLWKLYINNIENRQ